MYKVILFQPQIPQNTGNIVRTCAVTGSDLILVRPLGFSTSNSRLKRAGLDYWEGVNVSYLDDLLLHLKQLQQPFYFFSSRGKKRYTEIDFEPGAHLIFGSEDAGLPAIFHETWPDEIYSIPMIEGSRCLNLANSVSIVLYEAWRQGDFIQGDITP